MAYDDGEIEFYLRHRRQITEWAALRKDAERLMRDAVSAGSKDAAINVLMGASGRADVDFYVRNRSVINEWAGLWAQASSALHGCLVQSARAAGCEVDEARRGWTTAAFPSGKFAEFPVDAHLPRVEMIWTKGDLLKVGGGYPFPRVALARDPRHWQDGDRERVKEVTRGAAKQMGMTNHKNWSLHWGVLPEISDSQSLTSYADSCVATLRERSERLLPLVLDAMATVDE